MSAINASLAANYRDLEPVAPCSLRLAGTVDVKGGYGKMYRAPFGGLIADAIKAGKLTATDGWVYACICAHAAGNSGVSWPGRKTIAEGVGIHPRTVSRSVARLELSGLISIDRSANRVNRYRILTAVGGGHAGPQGVARLSPPGDTAVSPPSDTPVTRTEQRTEQRTLSCWREKIKQGLHRFASSELSDLALDELLREHGPARLEATLMQQLELGDERPRIKYSKLRWYHARCREAPGEFPEPEND